MVSPTEPLKPGQLRGPPDSSTSFNAKEPPSPGKSPCDLGENESPSRPPSLWLQDHAPEQRPDPIAE